MKKLMEDTKMKKMGKELYRFVQRIYDEVLKIPPDLREKRLRIRIIDELSALRDATDFLEKEMGAKVEVYSEEDSKKFDPKDRAKLAQPYRVAIYILSKGEPQY